MCQFGDASYIIKELNIPREQSIRGFRNWYLINSFSSEEKFLKSLNMNYTWSKNEIIRTDLTRYDSLGYYNYSYYNYSYCNYSYYNYNYNNYYYNYNYSYYNYNYYNYNYNNYNNYNICGATQIFGKIFAYKEGFRSEFALPEFLVIIDNKELIEEVPKFVEHFNDSVINIAKEYKCETINWSEYVELPKTKI